MARKKKPSRKYMPRDEFRKNHSPSSRGHNDYIFGETKSGNYKSFGLTTTPDKKHPTIKLHKNPNPNDDRNSYISKKPRTTKKEYFGEKKVSWHFSLIDRAIVRHNIKKYKKACKRSKNKNKKR